MKSENIKLSREEVVLINKLVGMIDQDAAKSIGLDLNDKTWKSVISLYKKTEKLLNK